MKRYGIFSIVFLLLSMLGGLFLVKRSQDTRNRAADESCSPIGRKLCQENSSGANTGFLCECLAWSQYQSSYGYWRCTTPDLSTCPTNGGGTAPSMFSCSDANARIEGRCIVATSGTLSVVNKYQCPNRFDTAGGCQDNVQTFRNVDRVCFDSNYCGVQQIDLSSSCFISTIDYVCESPTSPPKSTNTPTPRPTNTPIPTSTPRPTSTPTPTNTPIPTATPSNNPTPTNTPVPTSTPTNNPTATVTPQSTNTPAPTNTPVPATGTPVYIAEGPSPTRIILPQSGVEFPSQFLTILGGIVTLLGFLILL